jgi:hypothetical protein
MMRPTTSVLATSVLAISGLALSALVAGTLSVGTTQAQTMQPQTMQPHSMQPQTMQPQGTAPYGGTTLGAPQGTTGTMGTMGTSSGTPAPTRTSSNVGPIGSGALAGVGPPTDGLDSNPYAEASPQVRKALGHDGQAHQSASAPRGAKAKSGTLN